jgi:hypothetical protein
LVSQHYEEKPRDDFTERSNPTLLSWAFIPTTYVWLPNDNVLHPEVLIASFSHQEAVPLPELFKPWRLLPVGSRKV